MNYATKSKVCAPSNLHSTGILKKMFTHTHNQTNVNPKQDKNFRYQTGKIKSKVGEHVTGMLTADQYKLLEPK